MAAPDAGAAAAAPPKPSGARGRLGLLLGWLAVQFGFDKAPEGDARGRCETVAEFKSGVLQQGAPAATQNVAAPVCA